ncbi:hypothetical protein ACIOC2_20420 [Streptomyces sp. NPDC088337]|uniref:hypothetical protein n=1 Tax=unclassified Streptomyces TaxID=2593676 RepID=UPI0037F46E1E
MPRQVDQLPSDATSLARRVRALEREMRELRASRRAGRTTITDGAMSLFRPGEERPAATMSTDLDGGGAGFQSTRSDGKWARLESGALQVGQSGVEQFLPTLAEGMASGGVYHMTSGMIGGGASQAHLLLISSDSPLADGGGAPRIVLGWDGDGTTEMVADVAGILQPRSMAWGQVSITPSAVNTPTAASVGGLSVRGSAFFAFTTPSSGVPGTQVTGTSASNVSGSGLTVWLTRTNLNTTGVNWLVIGI